MKFRNWLKRALNVTKMRTGSAGETVPAAMPSPMAIRICGRSPSLIFFISGVLEFAVKIIKFFSTKIFPEENRCSSLQGNKGYEIRLSPKGGGYFLLMMEVSGYLLPLMLVRKALAEPKFKYISRRTGRWLRSSVT